MLRLLLLSISLLSPVKSYKKCCPAGKELSQDRTSCVRKYSENTVQSLADSLGFEIQTTQNGVGFPSCSELESLKFSGLFKVSEIEGEEVLLTPKYKDPVSGDNFCIDTWHDEVFTVTCNQCEGKICIHLCCPFGQQLKDFEKENEDILKESNDTGLLGLELLGGFEVCESNNLQLNYELDFLSHENLPVLWNYGAEYMVIGPLHRDALANQTLFQCSFDDKTNERPLWFELSPHESRNISLHTDGYLRGVVDHNHPYDHENIDSVKFVDVTVDNFCVGFRKGTKKLEQIDISYHNCHFAEQDNECEKARYKVFNIAFFISIVFLMVAIIAHMIEPQLRDSIFGKISIMYLTNILLHFIFLIIERLASLERETGGCIALGYLTQYFNLAFFFSISAMAFFFFVNLRQLRPRSGSGSKKMLKRLLIYAQGMPLLICIITAIVDEVRKFKQYPGSDAHYFPEMGLYSCYLGYENIGPRPSYFTTPEFLYVQMYQLIILVTNLVMFVKTTVYIVMTRQEARTLSDHEHYHKENFLILIKLFVYMFCVWILEIVTSAIAAEHGINATCPIRFVLDITNAFYGVIIFLVMVWSKPLIRRSLCQRVRDFLTCHNNSSARGGCNNIEIDDEGVHVNSLSTFSSTVTLTRS